MSDPAGTGGGDAGAGGAGFTFSVDPTVAEFRPSAPQFQPSISSPEFTPSVPAAVFAPEFTPSAPAFQPNTPAFEPQLQQQPDMQQAAAAAATALPAHHQPRHHAQAHAGYHAYTQPGQHGDATYYYSDEQAKVPLQFPFALPHIADQEAVAAARHAFFMSEDLRTELLSRQQATELQIEPGSVPNVPAQVDNYHSLVPLETLVIEHGKVFQFPSMVYKAFSATDGRVYCLRRLSGCRLTNQQSMSCVEAWKKIKHASIVNLREVFTTKDFQDHSVVFVYDFHPHCDTLLSRHIVRSGSFLPEPLLWTYIIQLTCAIREVHTSNLAVRALDLSKVLVTGHSRIMLGSVGLFDVVEYENEQVSAATLSRHQQEDMLALGRIILALSCGTLAALARDAVNQSMAHVLAYYSEDVSNILRYLLGPPPPGRPGKSVNDLMPMIGARFYTFVSNSLSYTDTLEHELSKELQNGRLFRLASKLMMVTDRPETQGDRRWAETGDRYLLSLLKSYIFHTVDEEGGRPWVDLAHIVQCLNKLDLGSPERICLVSPDDKNIVVVSYADLRRCLGTAFSELCAASDA